MGYRDADPTVAETTVELLSLLREGTEVMAVLRESGQFEKLLWGTVPALPTAEDFCASIDPDELAALRAAHTFPTEYETFLESFAPVLGDWVTPLGGPCDFVGAATWRVTPDQAGGAKGGVAVALGEGRNEAKGDEPYYWIRDDGILRYYANDEGLAREINASLGSFPALLRHACERVAAWLEPFRAIRDDEARAIEWLEAFPPSRRVPLFSMSTRNSPRRWDARWTQLEVYARSLGREAILDAMATLDGRKRSLWDAGVMALGTSVGVAVLLYFLLR